MFTVTDDTQEITVTQAGALAGVSGELIRRAIKNGKLKVTRRVGVSILLDRADVERWARERQEGKHQG